MDFPRNVTINEQKWDTVNKVVEEIRLRRKVEKMVIAPHIIDVMGCGFMAVNDYCIVQGRRISRRSPESTQEHRLLGAPRWITTVSNVVTQFLKKVRLCYTYEIRVDGVFNLHQKIAVIPILVATWEFLRSLEPNIEDNGTRIQFLLQQVVPETEIVAYPFVVQATIEGSENTVIFMPSSFSKTTRAPITRFNEQYDFIFMKTNLHNPGVGRTSHHSDNAIIELFLNGLQTLETENNNLGVASQMANYSRYKIESAEYEDTQIELKFQTAMEAAKRNEENVLGFEIQRGGIVILMRKGTFGRTEILNEIAKRIAERIEGTLSFVFKLLQFAKGAGVVTEEMAQRSEVKDQFVYEVQMTSAVQYNEENEILDCRASDNTDTQIEDN